ncbi:hypothetical protein JNUCC31_01470 [Paenibacillus sp. JNUCC31]|uniref:hypothetical protein n=1 Tax=Paenibacillus sp. JNUCC-31 TaxID=2777983 RepID=UPI0017841C15|nr:hypothetical protein [Paenibacillus sp. JNUCC-31]QOS79653.1 hypothetical protein JNUCC31_01470 [Paenibacillus sp. JNUCC-31]
MMSQNTQQLMLFCTAVVLFVTACLYGQQNVKVLSDGLNHMVQTTANMEGRLNTTLHISQPEHYSGAEVLHTVRQMTGTTIRVEVDGTAYVMDPLLNRTVTIPVQLVASYRPEFIRSDTGEVLKIAFWKEASIP